MATLINWKGASGHAHTFEVFLDGCQFNELPGVYIFCKQIDQQRYQALYVGETHSFKQRLNTGIASHEGYKRARELGMTHICAMIVHESSDRLKVETDLRHGLNPPANFQPSAGGVY